MMVSTKTISFTWLTTISLLLGLSCSAYVQQHQLSRCHINPTTTAVISRRGLKLYAGDDNDESLTPLTSFGAEVVPEGQRPVNEYLDMKRAPLFDWASEEVGTQGVSLFLM